jgi:hypothetical protein
MRLSTGEIPCMISGRSAQQGGASSEIGGRPGGDTGGEGKEGCIRVRSHI